MMNTDKVIDFINVNRDRYLERAEGPARDPQYQRAARACARREALRRMVRRRDGPRSACRTSVSSTRRATPSSTATGSARRTRPRSCSTATTTCSRSIP